METPQKDIILEEPKIISIRDAPLLHPFRLNKKLGVTRYARLTGNSYKVFTDKGE